MATTSNQTHAGRASTQQMWPQSGQTHAIVASGERREFIRGTTNAARSGRTAFDRKPVPGWSDGTPRGPIAPGDLRLCAAGRPAIVKPAWSGALPLHGALRAQATQAGRREPGMAPRHDPACARWTIDAPPVPCSPVHVRTSLLRSSACAPSRLCVPGLGTCRSCGGLTSFWAADLRRAVSSCAVHSGPPRGQGLARTAGRAATASRPRDRRAAREGSWKDEASKPLPGLSTRLVCATSSRPRRRQGARRTGSTCSGFARCARRPPVTEPDSEHTLEHGFSGHRRAQLPRLPL